VPSPKRKKAAAKSQLGGKATGRVRRGRARANDLASEAKAAVGKIARQAGTTSAARVRDLSNQARKRVLASLPPPIEPHLCLMMSPRAPVRPVALSDSVRIATYNVHRWQGTHGRSQPDVARAGAVIGELDADVIALQEVLRPEASEGEDPLRLLCDELNLYLVFAGTRRHRRGQLGNAILSKSPISSIAIIDISFSRFERRGALVAQIGEADASLGVIATHLSLVDRTRHRQVQSLLDQPQLNAGPTVLLGDMNSWRNCKGSKELEGKLNLHHNVDWPASFPSARPLLALDRIYVRKASVVDVRNHNSKAARKASDHLPVIAEIQFEPTDVGAGR
jgi:endonuclease/exonuclease/phosphatase family metal-dependent hydrolase